MKSNRFWIAVIGVFLVLCAAAAAVIVLCASDGNYAVVRQGGKVICKLDLSRDIRITLQDGSGGFNVVEVKDGGVCVAQADCPDQICVRQGVITDGATPIVCLPHALVIEVTKASDLDAVAK